MQGSPSGRQRKLPKGSRRRYYRNRLIRALNTKDKGNSLKGVEGVQTFAESEAKIINGNSLKGVEGI